MSNTIIMCINTIQCLIYNINTIDTSDTYKCNDYSDIWYYYYYY